MMYFTETEALRELEILMQMIPGFQPNLYLSAGTAPAHLSGDDCGYHACCPIPPLPAKSGGTSNRKRDEAHELSKQSPSETFPDSHPEKRQEKLCPVVGTLSFYRRSEALAHHEASGGWEPHPV